MNLLFPQWQGAGNSGLCRGALELASSRPTLNWQQMDVAETFGDPARGINAYAEVAEQLGGVLAFLARNALYAGW